jgi:hypothetical protein
MRTSLPGTNGALCSLTKTKRFNNEELYYGIMENEETVEGQIKNHIRGLVNRLEGWIYGQKKLLDDFFLLWGLRFIAGPLRAIAFGSSNALQKREDG